MSCLIPSFNFLPLILLRVMEVGLYPCYFELKADDCQLNAGLLSVSYSQVKCLYNFSIYVLVTTLLIKI